MLKPYFSLAVLVLAFSSHAALAQTWTLDQVMQSALATHPAVLGKLSSSAAARAEREGAEWQRYPVPSVEAAAQNGGGTSTVARLQQPLWTGGRITAGIEAAGRRFDAAEAAVVEARQEIGLKVIAAFTEAQRQQLRQATAITGVNEHEKLLKMITRRVEREVSPPVDKGFAQSRLFQAANDLSAVAQARANALTQLSQLAGQAVGDITGEMSNKDAPASREAALEQAIAYSPTLKRLAFEEAAADEDIASKRSAYMPQLAVRLEHSTGSTTGLKSDSRALLVLEAQPGAGLSAISGVNAAIARREAVRQSREATLRDLRERVNMDWNELVAARLRLDNAHQARAMSAEVFESYARQYTAGRKTWIDVLNAVREATQSEFAVADAEAQATAAALRLRLLTSGLNEYVVKNNER